MSLIICQDFLFVLNQLVHIPPDTIFFTSSPFHFLILIIFHVTISTIDLPVTLPHPFIIFSPTYTVYHPNLNSLPSLINTNTSFPPLYTRVLSLIGPIFVPLNFILSKIQHSFLINLKAFKFSNLLSNPNSSTQPNSNPASNIFIDLKLTLIQVKQYPWAVLKI